MSGPAKTEGQPTEGCRGKGESSSRCPGYCRFAQCRSNPNASMVVSDVKRFFEKGGNQHLQVYSAMCNYQATSETTTIINNIWIYVGQKTQSRKQRMQKRFIWPHLASWRTGHSMPFWGQRPWASAECQEPKMVLVKVGQTNSGRSWVD